MIKRGPIVHMLDHPPFKLKPGQHARTRCGISACTVEVAIEYKYQLLDESGNQFTGTVRETVATCLKCVNLINVGTINDRRQSGTTIAACEAVDPRRTRP